MSRYKITIFYELSKEFIVNAESMTKAAIIAEQEFKKENSSKITDMHGKKETSAG